MPQAFLATGDQGVNYAKNIWHHPLLALQAESDFLVVDRGGANTDSHDNKQEFSYPGETFVIVK